MNIGLSMIGTKYVLLVDSDIILLKDIIYPFEKFKYHDLTLMGEMVENVGGKVLYPRIVPWFCFINNDNLKSHKIKFFDADRTLGSKSGSGPVYDIGSTMFEDVSNNNLNIADTPNLENKYFKHYGGMSWRTLKYDPFNGDTDIDFGGTHPHSVYYDMGVRTHFQYLKDTEHMSTLDIRGKFK